MGGGEGCYKNVLEGRWLTSWSNKAKKQTTFWRTLQEEQNVTWREEERAGRERLTSRNDPNEETRSRCPEWGQAGCWEEAPQETEQRQHRADRDSHSLKSRGNGEGGPREKPPTDQEMETHHSVGMTQAVMLPQTRALLPTHFSAW